MKPLETPRSALAIGSHPDDIEFGAGATLARWAENGCEVHLLVLTDGSKGSWDGAADLAELIKTREKEAQAAADQLGAASLTLLGYLDGELQSGIPEREAVARVIRSTRPEVLLGHDPWRRYRLHPDHRHAGWLTIDGLVAARDPHFFPSAGPHHRPNALLLFEADSPNHWEPAGEHIGVKVDALLEHKSQWHSTMGIIPGASEEASQRSAFISQVREHAARNSKNPLLPDGLYEAFHLITAT